MHLSFIYYSFKIGKHFLYIIIYFYIVLLYSICYLFSSGRTNWVLIQ